VDQGVRRLLLVAFIIATAAVTGLVSFAFSSKDAVGYGQQCSGGNCWGYRLDQSRFVAQTRLTFWSSSGLNLRYSLPPGKIVPVHEDRWLDNGRAVYLNFRIQTNPKSSELGDHVRVVYDFQRGELHVSSLLPLWRNGDPRNPDPGHSWLTDNQFDIVLIQIDPTM
jgi:hypothetical protein